MKRVLYFPISHSVSNEHCLHIITFLPLILDLDLVLALGHATTGTRLTLLSPRPRPTLSVSLALGTVNTNWPWVTVTGQESWQEEEDQVRNCLDHYGIRGTTLNWIQNFLTDRTQKVVVDGSSSESARVRSGVPQGTVLGPLLFLTYINDLPSTVSSQVRLFADDCLLHRPIKCRADQEQLQRDLSALQDWADR